MFLVFICTKEGNMSFLSDYYEEVDNREKATKIGKKIDKEYERDSSSRDTENLIKIILTWAVGGIISLIPTFTYIYHGYSDISKMENVVKDFFANKDLFLVVTTLTASAMLEFIFSDSDSHFKYFSIAFGIILMVFSIHIFTFLQYEETIPLLSYIGEFIFGFCVINSICGYYIICKRKDKKST